MKALRLKSECAVFHTVRTNFFNSHARERKTEKERPLARGGGPKKLSSSQLRQRGSSPKLIAAREAEERTARQSKPARRSVPTPPKGLHGAAVAFFEQIAGEYALEPAFVIILENACFAMERTQQARDAIEADGLVMHDDQGRIIPHPALKLEQQATMQFARLVKQLDLPED
jgi:P27 family predicted phage terminase small subunit